MKTRSNMPLFVVECSDVKALSNSQIDLLRCGDYLVKKDASGEHAYKVTFKKEGVGMCLTYHDASVIETQSYDYVDGNWVYNSEDKTSNLLEIPTDDDIIQAINGEDISPKDVSASGDITGASIIENMSGYSAGVQSGSGTFTNIYTSVVKNGNKITFVVFGKWSQSSSVSIRALVDFYVPSDIYNKLYPYLLGDSDSVLDIKKVSAWSDTATSKDVVLRTHKMSNPNQIRIIISTSGADLTAETDYMFRYEATFLLSDSLIS